MKKYIFLVLLICGVHANGQNNSSVKFSPPFDFPLILSGNFGELRANHFHGGLDFKSQGASGKPVLAIGDGYISNIRVTHGSGYVLEVTYDNGYKTILRHNEAFVPPISKRVEDLQYEKESWEVEIVPEVNEYRVKAGQKICYGGNLGYSFGPHLHMDMIDTRTGDFIDPLPFFKSRIKDTKAPQALGFMLFPQLGKGVVNGETEPFSFTPANKKVIQAWGEVGAAIRAYDYADAANNRLGVHTVMLIVDGVEVFRSTVDRFSSNENRMINSWAYGNYMKSFKDPGNTLRLLEAKNNNRGLVTIDEERDYHFQYVLKDVYGNTSRYNFVVKGKQQPIEPFHHREKYLFKWDRTNFLKEPGLDLVVRKGELYDDVPLNYKAWVDSAAIAYTYQLNDKRIPLHNRADIQIGLLHKPVKDMSKYYIARVTDKGKLASVGGKYENGFMKGRIREIATYTVAIDTVAPKVTPVSKEKWATSGKITYKIDEKETGIRSYRGTIDGKYALFGLHIMNNRLIYKIDSERLEKGQSHVVEITVTDECGNTTVVTDTFKW